MLNTSNSSRVSATLPLPNVTQSHGLSYNGMLGSCNNGFTERKVRELQRLLIRSKSALQLSIRRVTQINKGDRTAGENGPNIPRKNKKKPKVMLFRRGMYVKCTSKQILRGRKNYVK